MTTDDLRDLAVQWLALSSACGWGVEGPDGADDLSAAIKTLARHEGVTDATLAEAAERAEDRPLGQRPVDALFASADLLVEAADATGQRRAELLSAARGWLRIAQGPR